MNLRSRLLRAFESHPRPAPTNIVRPEIGSGGERVRDLLQNMTVDDVSVHDVNAVFEGNLWMLTKDAFLYYLPALMSLALTKYEKVSVFASELIGALTKPQRADVMRSLDMLDELPPELAPFEGATADLLRKQQLEWFDSGAPTAMFDERFGTLSAGEGAAILEFLEAFREQHGANFPFGEVDAAIDGHWAQFRGADVADRQTE
jgi:hypothetical protein